MNNFFLDAGDYDRTKDASELFIRLRYSENGEIDDVCNFGCNETKFPKEIAEKMVKGLNQWNVHVFRVVHVPMTATLPSRTRVYSERFKQFITLSNNDSKFDNCRDAQERAVLELKQRGFNIVAIGEGVTCMYVISDTFKPLLK